MRWPSPAVAFNPIKPVCAAAGFLSGLIGKACSAVQHGDRLLSAGKNLLTGHVGGAVKSLVGDSGSSIASKATTALALAAIATWVVGGRKLRPARDLGRPRAGPPTPS